MLNQLSTLLPGEAEKDFSASNWKYRRTIIFMALGVAGFVILLFALAVSATLLYQAYVPNAIVFDRGLIGLAETLIWSMATMATSIIAAYVFGANMDTSNFRKSVLELSNKSMITTEIKKETTVTDSSSPQTAVVKTETTQAQTVPAVATSTAGAPIDPPKPNYGEDGTAG